MLTQEEKLEKASQISFDVFTAFKSSSFKHLPEEITVGEFLDMAVSVAATFMAVMLKDVQDKSQGNTDMTNLINQISAKILLNLESLKADKIQLH